MVSNVVKTLRYVGVALALTLGLSADAWAQSCSGQFAAGFACGNSSGSKAPPSAQSLSSLLDRNFGAPSLQGSILNRGSSLWLSTQTPVLGVPGSVTGSLGLAGSSGGTLTVKAPDATANWTFKFPVDAGTSTYVLVTDGAGNTSWASNAAGGTVTSVALAAPAEFSVSGSPVTTSGTLTFSKATQSANRVWAGPTTGGALAPTFRALVGADLPNPSASTLGGIQSYAGASSQWIRSISTSGVPASTQPAFSDISGTLSPTQCPTPTAITLGCVESLAAVGSRWINQISTSGVPSASQPAFSDLSGSITLSQFPSISNRTVLGNNSGGTAIPSALTGSQVLDFLGSTQGNVLYRDAGVWNVLAPGTSGQVLVTGGAAANPSWQTVAGTGTVTQVDTGAGLTGGPITGTGTVALAAIANNTVLANISGGSLAPSSTTPTLVLDTIGSTEGNILYRGASVWAVLAPGTTGQVLQTQGAGSTPQWANAGTVSSVATGWGLTGGAITTSGTLSLATSNPARGFDVGVNLQLNASVGSNLLTIAVKGNDGNDPSATNPVLIPFRDATIANGGPVWVAITSALSISTNATGATLGSTNSTPFRFWIVAFNNGGTPVLALVNASTATRIFPLNEGVLVSTTGISGSATSAGVFYTPNGTTLSSKAFRILGYLDYASGLATAGTYGSAPTTVQLFGPGVKKPGEVVQTFYATNSTAATNSTTSFVATNSSVPVTTTASPNLVRVAASGPASTGGGVNDCYFVLRRGTSTNIGAQIRIGDNSTSTTAIHAAFSSVVLDAPGTVSSTTYAVYSAQVTGSQGCTYSADSTPATIIVDEIQG